MNAGDDHDLLSCYRLAQNTQSLDQIELKLQSERQIMMVAHQVEQQKIAATHAAEQQKMLAAHAAEHAKLKAEFELSIQKIYESIVLARRRKFGPSSEANSIQRRLFDEAELLALKCEVC